MIFQHTWEKVLQLQKTRTSRLRNNGDLLVSNSPRYPGRTLIESPLGKVRWEVGKDYAVQPGRGEPTIWWAGLRTVEGELRIAITEENDCPLYDAIGKPLRIKVNALRGEDVRHISPDDVKAEGFLNLYGFMHTWVWMHDPAVMKTNNFLLDSTEKQCSDYLMSRPADRFNAWVINFELFRG